MLDLGIPADDIRTVVKTNPDWLLGLDPIEEPDEVSATA